MMNQNLCLFHLQPAWGYPTGDLPNRTQIQEEKQMTSRSFSPELRIKILAIFTSNSAGGLWTKKTEEMSAYAGNNFNSWMYQSSFAAFTCQGVTKGIN